MNGIYPVSYTHLDVYKRQELYQIYKEIPVSKFIRIQRLRWAGHVMRMEDGRNPKRALLGIWEGTRPRGRPRKRWEDGVAEDARDMGIRNCRRVATDRVDWRRRLSLIHI